MPRFQRHALPVCLALAPFLAPAPAVAAYQFYMDSFMVAKGFPDGAADPFTIFTPASVKFLDDFDAGGPPPDLTGVINADQNNNSSPDFSYAVNVAENGTVGPEVNYQGVQDLLSLNSAHAAQVTNVEGNLVWRQLQLLNAESGTGLGRNVTFSVAGVFQWIVPDAGQSYGIQVQDRNAGNPGDDIISLRVRGLGGGLAETRLMRSVYDETNGLTAGNHLLDSRTISAPGGAAFIALGLVHASADTDQLYAGWFFQDAGFAAIAGSQGSFTTAAVAFHGETGGYRAAFFAVEPVPEPETWAMLLAGLGLVGWAARRRA